MALGRPLGAKLFLEGKEVPLIGATITSSVNQASIAYIDVVPHAEINNIKPRTQVEIAVRDYNNPEQNFPYVSAWEGEVFGYSFGKQVGGRTFTLSAIDYTSYWDNVLTYFFNTQQSLGMGGLDQIHAGIDANEAEKLGIPVQSTIGSNASYFKQIIDDELAKPGKNFLDAFVAVYTKISNVNDFYNFAEKKLRIIDRLLLNSSGNLSELLAQQEGREWFSSIIGQAGGFTTLRSVVQDLMSLIFHDFVPVPFPARVPKDTLIGSKLASTESAASTLGSFVFKPNLYMIPPPVCNIFFPDEYSSFQYSRNFFKEPTRLIYSPMMPFFQSGQDLALPRSYEPDSFQHFMEGTGDFKAFEGSEDTAVTGDPGHRNEDDTSDYKASNLGKKREGQFLTNEERIKGIWTANESMMPATTQFQGGVSDVGRADFIKRITRYLFYKKRFEPRQLQITSHLKLSVVPGFTVLILDDSAAEQNVVAYCSSVTHRIYATEGGYTNVSLSYARTVTEQEQATTVSGEPIVPPWFSEAIFGSRQSNPTSKAAADDIKSLKELLVTPPGEGLSGFYKSLLGTKGYKSITDFYTGESTLPGSVARLLEEYRTQRSKGSEDLQSFISLVTSRDYVKLEDVMGFLGAKLAPKVKLDPTTLVDFSGGAFDTTDPSFGAATAERLKPINLYRDALMQFRGFRG